MLVKSSPSRRKLILAEFRLFTWRIFYRRRIARLTACRAWV